MRPGIFETVFQRDNLSETFAAVARAGFESVQFHPPSAGFDPWKENVPHGAEQAILAASTSTNVRIPAIDATFNMCHPDARVRDAGHQGLVRTIGLAAALDAPFATLCTGTRDTTSMWREHPDNTTPGAWRDMVDAVAKGVAKAEECGVTLLVEPEPANIASSAQKARKLLDEVASDHLKIVLDPANIVLSDRTRNPLLVLEEAFDTLAADIVFAHAKDLDAGGRFCAAGTGIVPWSEYWTLLEAIGYQGDVIFHTLTEADVERALSISPWQ